MIDPVAFAIPVFLVLILAEAVLAARLGRDCYDFEDTVAALATGICQRALLLVVGAALLVPYEALATHAPVRWPVAVEWTLAIAGVDLAYYAWHRWTHETNLGWGSHVVHHQSERYNLAVALRQSMTEPFTSLWFYLPLALVGVSTEVFVTVGAVNLLYQFFLHTELIGRLGPLERVMNTPSHHRVHHGINRRYLDRNYAGMFIVWDRLFGTFEPEGERVVYGTLKPARAFEPLRANFAWFGHVARIASSSGPTVWGRSPAWQPPGAPEIVPEQVIADRVAYAPGGSAGHRAVIAVQLGVVSIGLMGAMIAEPQLSLPARGAVALAFLFVAMSWGDWMEHRAARWGQAGAVGAAVLAVALVRMG